MDRFPRASIAAKVVAGAYCVGVAVTIAWNWWEYGRWTDVPFLCLGFLFLIFPALFLAWFVELSKTALGAAFFFVYLASFVLCLTFVLIDWAAAFPNMPGWFSLEIWPYFHWGSILFCIIAAVTLHRRDEREFAERYAARRREEKEAAAEADDSD